MSLLRRSTPNHVIALFTGAAFVLSLAALVYTHVRTEQSDSFASEELLNRAWREVRAGDLEAASDSTYLAEFKSQTYRGLAYRGYLQYVRGSAEHAVPYFQGALEQRPDYAVGHVFLADAMVKLRQFDSAARHLESALELATQAELQNVTLLSTIHLSFGNLRRRQGSIQHALAHYREATATDPSNTAARLALADAIFERGDTETALKIYDQVLRREPTNPSHWLSVAQLLLLLEEYKPAESAMRRYLEHEPRSEGYGLLALAVREQGRDEEADRILEQSWRLRDLREPR